MTTGRLVFNTTTWSNRLNVGERNAGHGPPRKLDPAEVDRLIELMNERKAKQQPLPAGESEPRPEENKPMSQTAPRKTDLFTRPVMKKIHARAAAGESLNQLRRETNNGVANTTAKTLISYFEHYGLPWPLNEEPAEPAPSKPRPAQETALATVNGAKPPDTPPHAANRPRRATGCHPDAVVYPARRPGAGLRPGQHPAQHRNRHWRRP